MSDTCPTCKSTSLDNGVCLFCGPVSPRVRAAKVEAEAEKLGGAWKGFDRELGTRKRQEREAVVRESVEREERARSGMPWGTAIGGLVGVAVLGGLGYLLATGQVKPAVRTDILTGLPNALVKPPSAARNDLLFFARELRELTVEAEHKLTTNPDFTNADLDRYLDRLARLHDVGRNLEPQLTREEQRVLIALQRAEKNVGAFVRSFSGKMPDISGAKSHAALDQIERAIALARGEAVDEAELQRRNEAAAAQELRDAQDGQ